LAWASTAAASWQRTAQAAAQLPSLQKQWRRSGKIHSRLTHDIADGEIQEAGGQADEAGAAGPRMGALPLRDGLVACGCTAG